MKFRDETQDDPIVFRPIDHAAVEAEKDRREQRELAEAVIAAADPGHMARYPGPGATKPLSDLDTFGPMLGQGWYLTHSLDDSTGCNVADPPHSEWAPARYFSPLPYRYACADCAKAAGVFNQETQPPAPRSTDLDTFRAMLERAGIPFTAHVSVLDGRVSTFVQPGPGGLQIRFDVDGRLAAMAWRHEDDLVRVGGGE